MADDLTRLLASWPFESGRLNARVVDADDGRSVLQVRLELGVLQMELDGRPDGQRPDDFDSLLDVHRYRLRHYERETGMTTGFVLTRDECRRVREEVVQLHHRYVALFSLGDYERVVRDTQHSLAMLDLCHELGETEHDRAVLEQFRGSIITMRARAEAEMAIAARQSKQALAALDRALEELTSFLKESGLADEAVESSNEVQLLRGMRDALIPKLPSSQRVELQERLQAALDSENYELAAILRDELRLLGG